MSSEDNPERSISIYIPRKDTPAEQRERVRLVKEGWIHPQIDDLFNKRKEQAEAKIIYEKAKKIEETEKQLRQERVAQAIEFLADEKFKDVQETVVQPLQDKLSEIKTQLFGWRSQSENFIKFVYETYTNDLKKAGIEAIEKEVERWQREVFDKKVHQLNADWEELDDMIIDEFTEVFETALINFAKRLGKEEKMKRLIEESNQEDQELQEKTRAN